MTTILLEANALIYGERADDYGPFAHNAARLADLWNAYLWDPVHKGHREIKDEDVPAMLVLLKVMRLAEDPTHRDSWTDIAGYAGCAGKLESIYPSEERQIRESVGLEGPEAEKQDSMFWKDKPASPLDLEARYELPPITVDEEQMELPAMPGKISRQVVMTVGDFVGMSATATRASYSAHDGTPLWNINLRNGVSKVLSEDHFEDAS